MRSSTSERFGSSRTGNCWSCFRLAEVQIAEVAFEALVERHGAMVLRVCRAQLVDTHDAQDAFQATFLILVKKARRCGFGNLWARGSIRWPSARRCVLVRLTARRRKHERRAAEMATNLDAHEEQSGFELERVLHQEINRLPDCYRVPIVLCDLQGLHLRGGGAADGSADWNGEELAFSRSCAVARPVDPAATRAVGRAGCGVPVRRGFDDTCRKAPSARAVRALSNWMTAGEVSASVRTLVEGVLKTMLLSKLRTTATAVFAVALLTAGLGAVAWVAADDSNKPADGAKTAVPRPASIDDQYRLTSDALKDPGEVWALTLAEAIRIGLENADEVRVISVGGNGTPSKIAPRNRGVDVERFKARGHGPCPLDRAAVLEPLPSSRSTPGCRCRPSSPSRAS